MRKIYFVRAMLLMLLCSVLLPGCKEISEPEQQPLPEGPSLIERWKQDIAPKDVEIRFEALQFAKLAELSWWEDFDVVVRDGNLYLSGILYESMGYKANPGFRIDVDAMRTTGNMTKLNAIEPLTRLQSRSCYLLKTDAEQTQIQKIAVCEMDGTYYFLSFFDLDSQDVMRIHSADVKHQIEARDDAERAALDRLLGSVRQDTAGIEKVTFTVEQEDLHDALKKSGIYQNNDWYYGFFQIVVSYDADLAADAEWYQQCAETDKKSQNEAFYQSVQASVGHGEFYNLSFASCLRLTYHTQFDFEQDYRAILNLADLGYVTKVGIVYRFAIPSGYMRD